MPIGVNLLQRKSSQVITSASSSLQALWRLAGAHIFRDMSRRHSVILAALASLPVVAIAHHTYAMFDGSKTLSVSGTIAKLEWKNPHVFVWMYVPSKETPGKYDLWAFENGSPTVLEAHGWSKNVLKAGDKITVEYWPLRSGAIGGHWEKGKLADGRVLQGASDLGRK